MIDAEFIKRLLATMATIFFTMIFPEIVMTLLMG